MSMQLKWNARAVVERMQQEFPAVVEYAMFKINQKENSESGTVPYTLPKSSVMVLRCIVHDIISINGAPDVFDYMSVEQGNWLLLNKRVYQWVAKIEDLNEVLAFKLL